MSLSLFSGTVSAFSIKQINPQMRQRRTNRFNAPQSINHKTKTHTPGGSSLLGPGSSSSALANRLSLPLPLTACHRCDVCGKLLSTKLTLKRHKEQQHLQPLNNAVCNLCHKVFRTLNSLNNHKSIYHRRQKHHQFGGGGSGGGMHHGHQGPPTHLGMHSPISPTQSNNPHKLEFM